MLCSLALYRTRLSYPRLSTPADSLMEPINAGLPAANNAGPVPGGSKTPLWTYFANQSLLVIATVTVPFRTLKRNLFQSGSCSDFPQFQVRTAVLAAISLLDSATVSLASVLHTFYHFPLSFLLSHFFSPTPQSTQSFLLQPF